jgi:hypothetical protein
LLGCAGCYAVSDWRYIRDWYRYGLIFAVRARLATLAARFARFTRFLWLAWLLVVIAHLPLSRPLLAIAAWFTTLTTFALSAIAVVASAPATIALSFTLRVCGA